MSNIDRHLDDLKSGKGILVAKKLVVARLIFYLSFALFVLSLTWSLIGGFKGLPLYSSIFFAIISVVSKIIYNNFSIYLRYGSSPAIDKNFHRKKLTIIGVGLSGTLFLGDLKYKRDAFSKYLNLIAVNDDIRTEFLFDGYIRLPSKQLNDFELPETQIQKLLLDSEFIAIVADYQEEVTHFVTPR